MKRLFLASSIETTGPAIANELERILKKKAENIKLAFISTAGEAEKGDKKWQEDDYKGLFKSDLNLFDYTITGKNVQDFYKDLGDCDVIHMNGGNTFYLLLQIRKSGFDKWITEKVISGEKIYIGSSAGSMVASPDIEIGKNLESIIYEKELKTFDALNLIPFMAFPHWGSEIFKDLYMNERMKHAYKTENKIILLNDFQYVKVEGDAYKIVDIRD